MSDRSEVGKAIEGTPHPQVLQLRFARSEFLRGLDGVSEDDGLVRKLPMNSIGWIVGHMANQEHRYWVVFGQGKEVVSGLRERVGTGRPASTPPLSEMWSVWRTVTAVADDYLDRLTVEQMRTHLTANGQLIDESVGTMLLRVIYHYWYHTGEAAAVRQLLGHGNLPEFVGDMDAAPFQP